MDYSKSKLAVNTPAKSVNAWIYLDEDDPSGTGYMSPNSSYQSLVNNRVYSSTDFLFICFYNTVADGNGYYTLEIGNAAVVHPGGLTTQEYMNHVIADSRSQNSGIKILATLNYNQDTLSRIFSNDQSQWQTEANKFAANLTSYLVSNKMDGFDVDWEGSFATSISAQQFNILFTAIRASFNTNSTHLYLTLSPASVGNLDSATINSSFDFMNLQLYSGFTSVDEFLNAGCDPQLIGYGAKFESNFQNADQAYAHYLNGFKYRGNHYPFNVATNWRLNSNNFEFEQGQQILLHQLIFNTPNASFDDSPIVSNAGNPPITALQVNSGDVLNSIQATNTTSSGTVFGMLQHGGNGGSHTNVPLQAGDVITQIDGYTGVWFGWNCVLQITIKTKNGQTYGPYGTMNNSTSKTPFSLTAPSGQSIVSFNGTTIRVPQHIGNQTFIIGSLDVAFG